MEITLYRTFFVIVIYAKKFRLSLHSIITLVCKISYELIFGVLKLKYNPWICEMCI